MKQEIEDLKNDVRWFLKAQPGYDENSGIELWASYHEVPNEFTVVYGDNGQVGIPGYGETPEEAFRDFVEAWHRSRGFEWIRKHK